LSRFSKEAAIMPRLFPLSAAVLAATLCLPPGAAAADALPVVPPVRETPTAFDDEAGGAADADDPAIWVHRTRPERSLVLGTLKNGGLAVYDLRGRELQRIDVPPAPGEGAEEGRFNNVDLALGVRAGERRLDLAVVSDRGRDRVRTYRVDPRGSAAGAGALTDVTAAGAAPVFSSDEAEVDEQRTAYGLAATVDAAGTAHVVTSRRNETDLALLRLVPGGDGRFGYTRVDALALPAAFRLPGGTTWEPCAEPGERPQVEGMVIDAVHGALYAAQEDVGIWRIALGGNGSRFGRAQLVDRVREYGVPAAYDPGTEECAPSGPDPGVGGTHLSADAEGLAIAPVGAHGGYLLASSQGDSTFAAYDRTAPGRYVGGFAVGDSGGVDGVEHSDGAAVVTTSLGPDFPGGLLVVHDGEERPEVIGDDGEPRAATDFTYVRWRDARRAIGTPYATALGTMAMR
jgi:3-phytase